MFTISSNLPFIPVNYKSGIRACFIFQIMKLWVHFQVLENPYVGFSLKMLHCTGGLCYVADYSIGDLLDLSMLLSPVRIFQSLTPHEAPSARDSAYLFLKSFLDLN